MANRIYLIRTEFKDMDTLETKFGFRMYDRNNQSYSDSMEIGITNDDMDFLELVLRDHRDEAIDNMMATIEFDDELGIQIGNKYVSHDDVMTVINNVLHTDADDVEVD